MVVGQHATTRRRPSRWAPWSDVARHLRSTAVAHVATIDEDGAPRVAPVWVDAEGESNLVFFTVEGSRKDRNVQRDARVALSITAPGNDYSMASVRGEVVERLVGEAAQEIVDRLSRLYTGSDYDQRSGFAAFVVRPLRWSAVDYSAQ
jgi:PPOX class probable F420-dependent enzyme